MGFKRSVVFALSRELGRKHLKKQLDLVNNWVVFWLNQEHKKSTPRSNISTSGSKISGSASETSEKTKHSFGRQTIRLCHTQTGMKESRITATDDNTAWQGTGCIIGGMTVHVRSFHISVRHVNVSNYCIS